MAQTSLTVIGLLAFSVCVLAQSHLEILFSYRLIRMAVESVYPWELTERYFTSLMSALITDKYLNFLSLINMCLLKESAGTPQFLCTK